MWISRLSIRGDSQLTSGHVEGAEHIPLMKVYAGKMRKLECRFHSLKLEHVPRGQDAAVKELSQIATKGFPIPFGVAVEKLSQPSAIPEEEEPEVLLVPEQGALQLWSCKESVVVVKQHMPWDGLKGGRLYTGGSRGGKAR
jgi:hypothetical protein